jgi:hypothetical protein
VTNMGRREALGVVGLAALAGTNAAMAQTVDTSTMLRAVVTIGTASYEYRQENGKDLGDFVSTIGNFTQGCIRVDVQGFPLTVFFRPDRNSTRAEVVFELGRLWSGTPANLGAYTVAIYRGATLLATVSVPAHYWFSRWRWQSAPRPVVADVAALISQGLLPPTTARAWRLRQHQRQRQHRHQRLRLPPSRLIRCRCRTETGSTSMC